MKSTYIKPNVIVVMTDPQLILAGTNVDNKLGIEPTIENTPTGDPSAKQSVWDD